MSTKAPASVSVKVFCPAHTATTRGIAGVDSDGDIRRFSLSLSSTHRPEAVSGGHEGTPHPLLSHVVTTAVATKPTSRSSGVFTRLTHRVAELAVPPLSAPFSLTWKGMPRMCLICEIYNVWHCLAPTYLNECGVACITVASFRPPSAHSPERPPH